MEAPHRTNVDLVLIFGRNAYGDRQTDQSMRKDEGVYDLRDRPPTKR
jgi:hypothetical protein